MEGQSFCGDRYLVEGKGSKIGGIKAYLHENSSASGSSILAVDIGFNTVIYTLYSCAQGEILTGKTFYKKGIHDMAVNGLFPEIQGHIRARPSPRLKSTTSYRPGCFKWGSTGLT